MYRVGLGDLHSIMEEIWKNALDSLRKSAGGHSVGTMLDPVKPKSFDGQTLTVAVPNRFFRDYLSEHYGKAISDALQKMAGQPIDFHVVIEGDPRRPRVVADETPPGINETPPSPPVFLNARYTFESFMVGSSNQFAHAAAQAVAESPATAYNPLFIYGAVGLGKTHLMHAIGHFVFERNPHAKLCYVSSESFTLDLINSIRHDRMGEFRNRYRKMDVLLVDDIQFIAGKDRTQEEFFHTFNTLYESKKQIVLSCDKYPKEMMDLEERLRSRFEWGLVADIQPPDLETKVAIFNKKAEENRIEIPPDVALYVAGKIRANVRQLEGCLIRLGAFSSLTKTPITIALAEKILHQILQEEEKAITIETIQKAVAQYFGLKVSDLRSKRRQRTISEPRQIAMFLSRELTKASLPEIGRRFGGKDHSTVIHSCKKIQSARESNPTIQAAIDRVRATLEV